MEITTRRCLRRGWSLSCPGPPTARLNERRFTSPSPWRVAEERRRRAAASQAGPGHRCRCGHGRELGFPGRLSGGSPSRLAAARRCGCGSISEARPTRSGATGRLAPLAGECGRHFGDRPKGHPGLRPRTRPVDEGFADARTAARNRTPLARPTAPSGHCTRTVGAPTRRAICRATSVAVHQRPAPTRPRDDGGHGAADQLGGPCPRLHQADIGGIHRGRLRDTRSAQPRRNADDTAGTRLDLSPAAGRCPDASRSQEDRTPGEAATSPRT